MDPFAKQTCTSESFLISEEGDTVTTDVMGRGSRNDTTTQDGDTRATPTDVKTTFNGVSVKKKKKKKKPAVEGGVCPPRPRRPGWLGWAVEFRSSRGAVRNVLNGRSVRRLV